MSQADVTGRRDRHKVKTLTGGDIELLHRQEAEFFNEAKKKYTAEYEFTAANDMRMVDRLLLLEVQMFRAQWMLAAGMDYDSVDLDMKEETELRRTVKEASTQIGEIQRDLGLTKAQRDKATHDSVGAYIIELKQRAKLHGVKREKELGKAIELCKELFAHTAAYKRSNEHERRKMGFETAEDLVDWVLTYMRPEFNLVDEHFRQQGPDAQKFWVRGL